MQVDQKLKNNNNNSSNSSSLSPTKVRIPLSEASSRSNKGTAKLLSVHSKQSNNETLP